MRPFDDEIKWAWHPVAQKTLSGFDANMSPFVCDETGKMCIRGTRCTLSMLVFAFDLGLTDKQISEQLEVAPYFVGEARRYVAEHPTKVDCYLGWRRTIAESSLTC